MNNRVLNKNPFGSISEKEIIDFQERNGVRLPSDYTNYLAEYNGGKFERSIYDEISAPYRDAVVHQMYGIHQGPKYASLQDNHKLYQHFDLESSKNILEHYFVFASTATGDLLMLDLRTFTVHLFQHELMQGNTSVDLESVIVQLAYSFASFISALLSQEQFDDKHAGSDTHIDFQKRLRALKLERTQEIARVLNKRDV